MNAIAHRRVTKYCDLPSGFALDGRFFRFESLTFGSGRVGYAVLGFLLLKTVDGGETWCNIRNTAPAGFAPRRAFALGGTRCWAACASTTGVRQGPIPVLATEDGAKRWDISWVGNPAHRYASNSHLFFVNEHEGWLAATQYLDRGQRCVLFRTTDGGVQWRAAHELEFSPRGLSFTSSDEGYLLAAASEQDRQRAVRVGLTNGSCRTEFLIGGHPTVLFRVTQSGSAVHSVMRTGSSLYAIGSTGSAASLVACGAAGSLIRKDGNANVWQRVKSGTRSDLNDLSFAKRGNWSRGLIVGEGGAVLGSADDGRTWCRLHHDIGREGLFRVQMTGTSTAVIASSDALYLIRVME